MNVHDDYCWSGGRKLRSCIMHFLCLNLLLEEVRKSTWEAGDSSRRTSVSIARRARTVACFLALNCTGRNFSSGDSLQAVRDDDDIIWRLSFNRGKISRMWIGQREARSVVRKSSFWRYVGLGRNLAR